MRFVDRVTLETAWSPVSGGEAEAGGETKVIVEKLVRTRMTKTRITNFLLMVWPPESAD
jgi:hypothetical protein